METVFRKILRWLSLEETIDIVDSNYVLKELPKEMKDVIWNRVRENAELYNSVFSMNQDEIIIDRREYVDNFWGKCRLSIKSTDKVYIEYKFLGYIGVVNGVETLVDSVKSLMELGD